MATKQENQNKVSYLKQIEEIIRGRVIEKEQREIKNLRVKIDSVIKAKTAKKVEVDSQKIEKSEKETIKETPRVNNVENVQHNNFKRREEDNSKGYSF